MYEVQQVIPKLFPQFIRELLGFLDRSLKLVIGASASTIPPDPDLRKLPVSLRPCPQALVGV
jgi:hypothetical protein